ncbi:MAG: TolC family protein, partial [Alphaproteobacteria bacterium]|nr:TolC family protein [Alphaproteobacteria bacterium]
MYKKNILWIVLFCCVSCTVGPDFSSPQIYSDAVVKNELELKKEGKLPQNWYENLDDEYLQKLILTGLNNNTDITIALARLKQARLTEKINQTDFLLQIGFKGGYNYQKGSDNIQYSEDVDYYSSGFDASWELDLWGKGRRQTEADKANITAAEYSMSNIKSIVAADIASDYVNLQKNIKYLKLAHKNADLQKKIFATIEAEYQNGLGDEIAYNQAKYLLNDTLSSIPQYENNIEVYKNSLSTLTGILPSQLTIPENTKLFGKINNKFYKNMYALPFSVIRLRPDVAAAEQKLKAQNALVGKAIAELYPNISISGLFGYSSQNFRKLFSSASDGYNYAPSIYLPLLDWDKLKNNIEVKKQEKAIAMENYKQTVLNALADIKNAFSNYKTSVASYQNKLEAENNMQKVVDINLKKYNNGIIKFTEVLDSEQKLIKAQEDTIATRAQI